MDFLDNAVSKAKEVFDVAYKKTEEAVNTGKQKFDVAAIENKLNKDYAKLGKIYYALIKDSEDLKGETLKIKTAIDEKNAKIEELKQQINDTKNKRTCHNCGNAVDKQSLYCNTCGAKLEFDGE